MENQISLYSVADALPTSFVIFNHPEKSWKFPISYSNYLAILPVSDFSFLGLGPLNKNPGSTSALWNGNTLPLKPQITAHTAAEEIDSLTATQVDAAHIQYIYMCIKETHLWLPQLWYARQTDSCFLCGGGVLDAEH